MQCVKVRNFRETKCQRLVDRPTLTLESASEPELLCLRREKADCDVRCKVTGAGSSQASQQGWSPVALARELSGPYWCPVLVLARGFSVHSGQRFALHWY